MRQTIADIARSAQVSTATVDRVLNGRAGVRVPTRERVLAAARASGYLPATRPSRPRPRRSRLDFILQSGPNTFMDLLASHLELACCRPGRASCGCIASTVSAPTRWRPSCASCRPGPAASA